MAPASEKGEWEKGEVREGGRGKGGRRGRNVIIRAVLLPITHTYEEIFARTSNARVWIGRIMLLMQRRINLQKKVQTPSS